MVERGSMMKKGGILEDVELLNKSDLTPEQKYRATNFSLEEHLRPAAEQHAEERRAKKRAIAAASKPKDPAANEHQQRLMKEVKDKLKSIIEAKELERKPKASSEESAKRSGADGGGKGGKGKGKKKASSKKQEDLARAARDSDLLKESDLGFTEDTSSERCSANLDDSTDGVSTFRHLLYASEKVTCRPGPDGKGPPVITYRVRLQCLSRAVSEVVTLKMWEVPKTGANIKVQHIIIGEPLSSRIYIQPEHRP